MHGTIPGEMYGWYGETNGTAALISKDNYLSQEFLNLEKKNLWPKTWQVACRLEEIPKIGDFVTYDIADDSIIVVRSHEKTVRAYHNTCPHRGNQLTEGCGRKQAFVCRYHGWTYNLDGKCISVQDAGDYGETLKLADLHLIECKVDTWGGFVFINMDPTCEPLAEFLRPIQEYLDPFEYENLRYRWYLELTLPANWKVAMEAFMDGYHVAATHSQLLPLQGNDYTKSFARGKHSHFGYWGSRDAPGAPSPRLNMPKPDDVRPGVVEFFDMMERDFAAIFTDRDATAAHRLLTETPPTADTATAFANAVEFGRQAAEAEGAGYPKGLDWQTLDRAGSDWHVFPNSVTLPYWDGAVWYRARPNGDNPDSCIFNIWSLKRYALGGEPKLQRRVYKDVEGQSFGLIVDQDIANIRRVHKGMKSRGFRFARPNPVQEMETLNFHRVLETLVLGEPRVIVK